jgi:hypothetical protein
MIEITTDEAPGRVRSGASEGGPSRRALVLHFAVVLGVSSLAAGVIGGPRGGVSTALGIGLAALNLLLMRRVLRALGTERGLSALWALVFPVKLVALVGAAFLLVHREVADPVPLAIGFALLPLSGVFLRPGEPPSRGARVSEPSTRELTK